MSRPESPPVRACTTTVVRRDGATVASLSRVVARRALKIRQRSRAVVLEITALDRPALGIDRREALAAGQHHAEARAEVLGLFVTEMTDDLDGRPLRGCRAHSPRPRVEIVQQGIEHQWKACELDARVREDILGLVHGLTPPSSGGDSLEASHDEHDT